MKEKSSGKTVNKGSIRMIQEITNRTQKMNQDMKRNGIFFPKELRKAHGGQRNRRRKASWPQ